MNVKKNPEAFKRLRSMTEALQITSGDLGGPVLVRMGQLHRKQQKRIFASEGSEGQAGRWPSLSDRYDARKREVFGRRKMLVLTGDMKDRFTRQTSSYYIQQFIPAGGGRGTFQFGAESEIAAAHLRGDPGIAPEKSETARLIFGGMAPRLPIRDMISKTAEQLDAFRLRLVQWYNEERIPQVLRRLHPGA